MIGIYCEIDIYGALMDENILYQMSIHLKLQNDGSHLFQRKQRKKYDGISLN
jgi:hypothetical protein